MNELPRAVFVDSNVLLDILSHDAHWSRWSEQMIERAASEAPLIINAVVYAEVSARYSTMEELNAALSPELFVHEPIPYEAAFLAGKVYGDYRRRKGIRRSPLPDFFIGAHAAVRGYRLLTRDAQRYKTYFPTVELIAPD